MHANPKRLTAVATIPALLIVALAMSLATVAAPAASENAAAKDKIRVGVFEPNQVFRKYKGRPQMMSQMRRLQQQARQAQQSGNRRAAQRARGQMQQQRRRAMSQYRQYLQKAAKRVAEDQNLTVVTRKVNYASGRIDQRDVTTQLTKALNDIAPDPENNADQAQGGNNRRFFQAASRGNLEAVKNALDQDTDVNATTPNEQTALMLAAYDGHKQVVQYLLDNGATVDHADTNGRTALMYAATLQAPDTVAALIDAGAKVNRQDDEEGFTPLMFAAGEGNVEVIRRLLDAGADPTITDTDGDTALDFAQRSDHDQALKLLKQHSE
jgi:Skp family chaperone for outer membrane proteins